MTSRWSKNVSNLQRNSPFLQVDQPNEGGVAVALTCWCGAPLPNKSGRGRKRQFCCPAHKQREYRNRRIEKRNTRDMLICNNALPILQTLDASSIDCLVTDPPYGYSFMGKDWDKAVPSVEIWKECLRVLKPGAFAFIMSAPRQDVLSQMIIRLSEAGFQTGFTSLYWAYASGFPKASNVAKTVDKRLDTYVAGVPSVNARFTSVGSDGHYNHAKITREFTAQSEQAKQLDGSYGGFQPKPAVEVILVCMKPLSEKTFVDQALDNGKGVTWLDDCRIPYEYEDTPKPHWSTRSEFFGVEPGIVNPQGRFPANLLVSDDALSPGLGDTGSFSRYFDLDTWFEKKLIELPASVRQTFPYLIVPKASKSEKNKGLDHMPVKELENHSMTFDVRMENGVATNKRTDTPRANYHPTVKPLKLMSYLITLGSRHGDVVLDPFMGSGTTCVAASQLGRRYIGIELHEEYVHIAQQRLENAS